MTSTEELSVLNAKDIYFDNDHHEAGSGGFGQVWFGYHRVLNKYVAVKIFHVTGGPQEKAFVENTIREEMGHLNKLNHNNIVGVLGWVKLDFAMGIVMEYCKNGNLRVLLLDKRIPLSVVLRVWLLSNIAKALACCHNFLDKRLVHGDVKPENILLTGLLICKLCDFGAAELATLTSSTTVTTLRRSKKKHPQYTQYYTAPEKLNDLGMKPTKELDTYAFGILMHMVLTREIPYRSGNLADLLDEIKNGLRPNCEAIRNWKATLDDGEKEIVEKLEELMKQCWDQNPSSRPTMTEVSDRLKELLDEQLSAVVEQHASDALKKMEEIYPPANLNPCIPLNDMWARKNPLLYPLGDGDDRFSALGDPTNSLRTLDEKNGRHLQVSIPNTWEDMEGDIWKRVKVQRNTSEYLTNTQRFTATLNLTVVTLERIQNPTLWSQFQAQKKKIETKLKNLPVTNELFHGTDAETSDNIIKDGFDKICAGRVTAEGRGVYFATTAKYSHDYTSQDQQGNRCMFLAEVVTGSYCLGNKQTNVPPKQNDGSPFDSVVDNLETPSIFVVFRNSSFYPLYLLTYKS